MERVTGQPLNLYTREQIFEPLGMAQTRWFMAEAPMDDHAALYDVQGGEPVPVQHYSLTTWPDGGVRTSVRDLARFFAALLQGGALNGTRIVSPASAAEMQRFQYTAEHKPDNVELSETNSGLFWQTRSDVTYVGHNGSDPGIRAGMLANLSKDTGVILFVNTSGDQPNRAFSAMMRRLFAHAHDLRQASTAPGE